MGDRPKQVTSVEDLAGKTIAKAWQTRWDERFLFLFTDDSVAAITAEVDDDTASVDLDSEPLKPDELVFAGFLTQAQMEAEEERRREESRAAHLSRCEASDRAEYSRLKAKYDSPTVKG